MFDREEGEALIKLSPRTCGQGETALGADADGQVEPTHVWTRWCASAVTNAKSMRRARARVDKVRSCILDAARFVQMNLGGLLNLERGPWWATLGPPFSCYQLSQNVVDNPS